MSRRRYLGLFVRTLALAGAAFGTSACQSFRRLKDLPEPHVDDDADVHPGPALEVARFSFKLRGKELTIYDPNGKELRLIPFKPSNRIRKVDIVNQASVSFFSVRDPNLQGVIIDGNYHVGKVGEVFVQVDGNGATATDKAGNLLKLTTPTPREPLEGIISIEIAGFTILKGSCYMMVTVNGRRCRVKISDGNCH